MTDDIFERWTSLLDEEITQDVVKELLPTINDDLWVAAACADRILDDSEAGRALLDLGLERTEPAIHRLKERPSRIVPGAEPPISRKILAEFLQPLAGAAQSVEVLAEREPCVVLPDFEMLFAVEL